MKLEIGDRATDLSTVSRRLGIFQQKYRKRYGRKLTDAVCRNGVIACARFLRGHSSDAVDDPRAPELTAATAPPEFDVMF